MKNLRIIIFFFPFSFPCFAGESITDMISLSADYLYPYSQFHLIESFCKSIWSDLDLFLTHEPFEQLEEKIPLLRKNIDHLLKEVKKMVFNSAESATFLPEDTIYLIRMVTVLANKYRLICQKIKEQLGCDIFNLCERFDEMRIDLEYLRESRDEIALME
jgi:hypothetical protein